MLLILLAAQMGPIEYLTPRIQSPTLVNVRHRNAGPSKILKRVGKLMAAGRCNEARTKALEGGEIDLAARVKQDCVGR